MKIKYYIFIILILVVVIGSYFYFQNTKNPSTSSNTNSNPYFYLISQIKEQKSIAGIFDTQGYVVKKYTCPPCLSGQECKPCMKNNIVISENNQPLASYALTNKEIIIFVDNPEQFVIGQKYNFSIKFLDSKSTGEEINDLELVMSNLIE